MHRKSWQCGTSAALGLQTTKVDTNKHNGIEGQLNYTLSKLMLYRVRGTGEKMDGGVRFQSTGDAEGTRNQSYPLTIGMKGATK